MFRKVRNCCETCENLVCVATTIGQLQHTEYLKPTFLDTFKWAMRPVFPETVTYLFYVKLVDGAQLIHFIPLKEENLYSTAKSDEKFWVPNAYNREVPL